MIGSYRWNLLLGGIVGLLTVSLAFTNGNLFLTALVRGMLSFCIVFILTYAFRWLLALIVMDEAGNPDEIDEIGNVGGNIDYTTPLDADEFKPGSPEREGPTASDGEQPGAGPAASFQAFAPPRIERREQAGEGKEPYPDPETAARALRRLTED